MKLSEQIRQMSPYSKPEKGCAQLFLAVLMAVCLAVIVPLFRGKFDWHYVLTDTLTFVGAYWLVTTIMFAVFDRRKDSAA